MSRSKAKSTGTGAVLDEDSVRAFLTALPKRVRRQVRLDHVDGIAEAVGALLPWLLPPVLAVLGALAAWQFGWSRDAAVAIAALAFLAGVPLAMAIAKTVETAAMYSRLGSLEGGRLPVCPQCRYSQRGTSSDHCPECACPVRIDIGPGSTLACQQCGYDLREHAPPAVCPECSYPVKASECDARRARFQGRDVVVLVVLSLASFVAMKTIYEQFDSMPGLVAVVVQVGVLFFAASWLRR